MLQTVVATAPSTPITAPVRVQPRYPDGGIRSSNPSSHPSKPVTAVTSHPPPSVPTSNAVVPPSVLRVPLGLMVLENATRAGECGSTLQRHFKSQVVALLWLQQYESRGGKL